MNYQFTVALNELPQRQPVKKKLGEVEVLLIRDGESVRAYQAKCPHAGAPLEQGAICGDRLADWQRGKCAGFRGAGRRGGRQCRAVAAAS